MKRNSMILSVYARHGMKGTDFRLREELADQIKALKEMKEMAAAYGFDISRAGNKMQKKQHSGCISDTLQQSRLRTELQ